MLIVIYVLAAFGWLTFSLLNYSSSEYKLKNDVLKAGLNACILQIIQASKNNELGTDSTHVYYLKQLRLDVDTAQLNRFVQQKFNNNYRVDYVGLNDKTILQLNINPMRIEQLESQSDQQRSIWWFQSGILLFLVFTGIFGVYYSINSLYKLNKQQNNFLLSVTHEFKTPIAAIRLMLQTSLNPKVNEEKRLELIDKSIQNTHRLEELTENMLTAMQIEYDKYQYNTSRFNLSELVRKVSANHKYKGEIAEDIQDDIYFKGDEFILRIAISNLIENAFKYGNENGIELVLRQDEDKIELEVKDQGIGIPKSEMPKIFNKFYRVQDEETRTTKGTGLGLFIVKRAVVKHGGKIWASENQPSGMIFTITLPLRL